MKILRKMTLWLLVLMMLLPTAAKAAEIPEDPGPASYGDALGVANEMVEALTEMIENGNFDDETAQILSGTTIALLEVQMGMVYTAEGIEGEPVPEETRDFTFTAASGYIREFDYDAGFAVCREEGYLCVESEAFDPKTNEQLDYLRFELVRREDTGETMLLFTKVAGKGLFASTSRYLIHAEGETVQALYSRTFGKILSFRIDLKQWADGTDYTWEKQLLYPQK